MADKKKILLIDDEIGFTNMMKLYLEKAGNYEVRTENMPFQAVSAALEFKPDMIFLDVIMPGLDGGDIAGAIKQDKDLKNVPLVFLTAIAQDSSMDKIEGLIGGREFLPKPVSGEQILDCIKKHLD